MEITYVVIVSLVTYILGAISKIFISSIPNKYIPIQNIIIGFISGFVCFFTKVEPHLVESIILCIMASTSAGGIADAINVSKKD